MPTGCAHSSECKKGEVCSNGKCVEGNIQAYYLTPSILLMANKMGVIEYILFAVAIVEIKDGVFSSGDGYITAHIQFEQDRYHEIRIKGSVQGLPPTKTSRYGFHVHEDPLLGNDCSSCGTHFNPLHDTHGPPGGIQGIIHFLYFRDNIKLYIYIYIYVYI